MFVCKDLGLKRRILMSLMEVPIQRLLRDHIAKGSLAYVYTLIVIVFSLRL